jgi:hypothetical protein
LIADLLLTNDRPHDDDDDDDDRRRRRRRGVIFCSSSSWVWGLGLGFRVGLGFRD